MSYWKYKLITFATLSMVETFAALSFLANSIPKQYGGNFVFSKILVGSKFTYILHIHLGDNTFKTHENSFPSV